LPNAGCWGGRASGCGARSTHTAGSGAARATAGSEHSAFRVLSPRRLSWHERLLPCGPSRI
jgi:hypothetical protein